MINQQYYSSQTQYKIYRQSMGSACQKSNEPQLNSIDSNITYSQEASTYDQLPLIIYGPKLKEILHRSVGTLTFLNKHKKISAGSGVLISKDTVLTAAHNIYDQRYSTENIGFKFYLGANGVGEEYHQFEGWRYPQNFRISSPSSKEKTGSQNVSCLNFKGYPKTTDMKPKENFIFKDSIVAICCSFRNELLVGSAFMIDKDIILTSAHNIYSRAYKQQYEEVKIYTQSKGVSDQVLEVQSIRFPAQFKDCKEEIRLQYDYALIKLKKPVDKCFISLAIPCCDCLLRNNHNNEISIFGYPNISDNYDRRSRYNEDDIILKQYGSSKKNCIQSVLPFALIHNISTQAGQSGSPVVLDNKIIAIHCGVQDQVNKLNIGRLITSDLIQNIRNWASQLQINTCPSVSNANCFHSLCEQAIFQYSSTSVIKFEPSTHHSKKWLMALKMEAKDFCSEQPQIRNLLHRFTSSTQISDSMDIISVFQTLMQGVLIPSNILRFKKCIYGSCCKLKHFHNAKYQQKL